MESRFRKPAPKEKAIGGVAAKAPPLGSQAEPGKSKAVVGAGRRLTGKQEAPVAHELFLGGGESLEGECRGIEHLSVTSTN